MPVYTTLIRYCQCLCTLRPKSGATHARPVILNFKFFVLYKGVFPTLHIQDSPNLVKILDRGLNIREQIRTNSNSFRIGSNIRSKKVENTDRGSVIGVLNPATVEVANIENFKTMWETPLRLRIVLKSLCHVGNTLFSDSSILAQKDPILDVGNTP